MESIDIWFANWFYIKANKGHVWKMDGDHVDIWAYAEGQYCNGPRCTVCGYGFCHHCHWQEVPEPCPYSSSLQSSKP